MKLQLEIDGQTRQVEIDPAAAPGHFQVRIDDQLLAADACLLRPGVLSLLIDGRAHRIVLDEEASELLLHIRAQRFPYRIEDPRSLRSRRRHAAADGPATLKASMPGRIVRVLVEKGQEVAAHQGVIVIEAMKMQNELKSPRQGRVSSLHAAPGDTVASGDILAIIE